MDEITEARRVAIVGATRVGVRDRLAALYDDNVVWATRLAYLITQDADLAQDVTQDAFVNVFARFKERVPPAEFAAYLRRTVMNLCNDLWRRKRIERRHEQATESEVANPPRDLDALRDLVSALRQVRASGKDQEFRVLFATEGRRSQILLSLEAFSKKSQKTPPPKFALAERHLSDWRR